MSRSCYVHKMFIGKKSIQEEIHNDSWREKVPVQPSSAEKFHRENIKSGKDMVHDRSGDNQGYCNEDLHTQEIYTVNWQYILTKHIL